MKVVIIGGVAGGATAAARLRRLNEEAEIVVLERGGYVSYANCGLPYYIGGVIRERAKLLLQTPEVLSAASMSTCASKTRRWRSCAIKSRCACAARRTGANIRKATTS